MSHLSSTSSSSNSSLPVSIRQKFTLPGKPPSSHILDFINCEQATLGLDKGVQHEKPKPGDYTYSGMHDQGPLPPPKEGGDIAQLLGCVKKAKELSDKLLTELIEEEKNEKSKSRDASKKQKTDR